MAKSLIVHQTTSQVPSGGFLHMPGSQFSTATELDTEYAATHDCIFSNLRLNVTAGGSGDNTLQFRKNAANGNLTATEAGTGEEADTAHTDSLIAGDVFSVAHTDTGTDAQYGTVTLNVEFDGQTGTFFRNSIGTAPVFDVASATQFIAITGHLQADGTATEADAQIKVRGYSKVDALQVRVAANARTTDTVFKLRVNGVDVPGSSITVGAGLTGLFMVTGIDHALADGDLICAAIVTGAGVEDMTLNFVGATLISAADASELWAGNAAGVARTASATPSYYVLGGNIFARSTAAAAAVTPGFAADCTRLRIYISANTYTGPATLTLFIDGVASDLVVDIDAGATGWIENEVDTETITNAQNICAEIVGGTANSITIQAIGVTLEQPEVVASPGAASPGLFWRRRGRR